MPMIGNDAHDQGDAHESRDSRIPIVNYLKDWWS